MSLKAIIELSRCIIWQWNAILGMCFGIQGQQWLAPGTESKNTDKNTCERI